MFSFLLKPTVDPVSATVLAEYDAQTRERDERFAKAWDAYCGNLEEPLKVKPGDYNDNITLSFPRVVVDKGVASLFGEEVEFKVKDGSNARTGRPQQMLGAEPPHVPAHEHRHKRRRVRTPICQDLPRSVETIPAPH